jgi:hypothetical protein
MNEMNNSSSKHLDRVIGLTPSRFIDTYVRTSRPVVISDGISRWHADNIWTGDYFNQHFGQSLAQVYDDLFTLQSVMPLRRYFDQYWHNGPQSSESIPYVRWYAKFKAVEFVWADNIFAALAPHWSLPYFIPDSEYLLPPCPQGRTISPVVDAFPGKGLFLSAAGARTRLHRDPWMSDAILCQTSGRKQVVMYAPNKQDALTTDDDTVDIDKPDPRRFPHFGTVSADVEDILSPGEILFIPAGWFHHVKSITNSISITWNFVHMARWVEFFQYLLSPIRAEERIVFSYFANRAGRGM